jgi:hypothetical protein
LRQFIQDSGQRFSRRFLTTHNLLIKNETKKSQQSKLGREKNEANSSSCEEEILGGRSLDQEFINFHIERAEVRQVWGDIWWKSGGVGNKQSPSLQQRFSKVETNKIALRTLGTSHVPPPVMGES